MGENIPKLSFFFFGQFRQLLEDFFDAHSCCLKATDFSDFGQPSSYGAWMARKSIRATRGKVARWFDAVGLSQQS
jgi:hypothetical protein